MGRIFAIQAIEAFAPSNLHGVPQVVTGFSERAIEAHDAGRQLPFGALDTESGQRPKLDPDQESPFGVGLYAFHFAEHAAERELIRERQLQRQKLARLRRVLTDPSGGFSPPMRV